ncbi:unnamed protein product, partial [Heterosigma akashiwo]
MKRKRENKVRKNRAIIEAMVRGGLDMGTGKLAHGQMTHISKKFGVPMSTFHRIETEAIKHAETVQSATPGTPTFVYCTSPAVRGNQKGRKCKYTAEEELHAKLLELDAKQRTRVRTVAHHLDVALSTVDLYVKKGMIKRSKAYVSPNLTTKHKLNRLRSIWSYIDPTPIGGRYFYCNMRSTFHLDEKWFFICRTSEGYYLCPEEEAPAQKVHRKSHISKVMFLCVVARPMLANGRLTDGKVGCWPVGQLKQQKRVSKNRAAGTWKFVNETIDFESYKQIVIDKVLPVLRAGCPWSLSHYPNGQPKVLYIQDDGAGAHSKLAEDPEFIAACTAGGFHFQLLRQPSQSPDLNVLDLGFFNHLQSLTWRRRIFKSPEGLIKAVCRAWLDSPNEALNDVYLTLQSSMTATIEVAGDNNYKLFPHMFKARRRNRSDADELGPVPDRLHVTQQEMEKLQADIVTLTQQL